MTSRQEGIYLDKDTPESFGLIFLRTEKSADGYHIGTQLYELWQIYEDLKKGIVQDFPKTKNLHTGNLSVLIGYGNKVFEIKDAKRQRPQSFPNQSIFRSPNSAGGGPIIEGSNLRYDKNLTENHATKDQIVIQFIANTEFAVNRAIVQTWKYFTKISSTTGKKVLIPSKFYTGHNRPDKRNWLGFHDGVSNMKKEDRPYAVYIAKDQADPTAKWTIDGSYMAFIRIIVDLISWWELSISEQELLVGREKLSGCPIIAVDKDGKLLKAPGCPVSGTTEVTESGNERFREHPPYGKQFTLPAGSSDLPLKYSHVGSVRKAVNIPVSDIRSERIFRQGFEFLDTARIGNGFEVGLNFVSFQNSPERIRGILSNYVVGINQYFLVEAAGLFFVPPLNQKEYFPGSSIFLDEINGNKKMPLSYGKGNSYQ